MVEQEEKVIYVGDFVRKSKGDYRFEGYVVSVFRKLNGHSVRYVVENDAGILHIFNGNQLEKFDD